MLRKIATVFVVILLLPVFASAQEYNVLKPDGKIYKYKGDLKNLEVRKTKGIKSEINKSFLKSFPDANNSNLNVIDTMSYPGPYGAQFGFYGQDWMVMWFEAPADLNLLKVGFATYGNDDAQTVEVKVVSFNWTKEEIYAAGVNNLGYYDAPGNGYNDITAFMDNPDIGSDTVWNSIGDFTEPFGHDIWSDEGSGFPILPVGNASEPTYQWVDLSMLPPVPQLTIGELFGIAIKHTGVDMGQNYVGMWYSPDAGVPLLKFYANGRNISPPDPNSDEGWWSRTGYSLLYAAVVELTGDRGPVVNSFTQVQSGLDTGPFTIDANITDDNPGDPGNAGVASVILQWSIDGKTTWQDVTMNNTGGDDYAGDIPVQSSNVTVDYRIVATDINSNSTTQDAIPFRIFGQTSTNLLVFNGYTSASGYPQSYYFGSGNWPNSYETVEWDHDVWAYGPLTLISSIINNYTNIIEITTPRPKSIDTTVIRDWLAGDPNRNYMLAGDEWLGTISEWTDGPHVAGEFQFDVLGINFEYNDIVSSQNGRNPVYPQAGTLGGPILDLWTQISADSGWTSDMMYDPVYEISEYNWLDGVDFEADVIVDMKGMSLRSSDSLTVYNVAGHRELPAGNKIAFFGYDPLSLNSGPDPENSVEYWWYGFMDTAPQVEILKWFDIPVSVEVVNSPIPEEFSISQNYPNPFNPSTTINFSIPKQSKVVLKVYDILGSEVATLVDGFKNAGNYEVNFNALNLASGMYIYTLRAGDFTTSKKMMLLK